MLLKILDDRKRELTFGAAPRRVVSLVPSDTYNVQALGMGAALVGRTDYCEAEGVKSVGGTKNPRLEDIAALEPDLILANQEENARADLEKLAYDGFKVLVCFPKRFADGVAHLARLARVFRVERDPKVKELIRAGYALANEVPEAGVPTFCPIWMKPLMTINGDTFISDVLAMSGAANIFADRERRYPLAADVGTAVPKPSGDRDTRYPRVTIEEVIARRPALTLLPDEPHPFSDEDAKELAASGVPGKIERTVGKDLCWYGAKSIEGLPRVRALVRAACT